MDITAVILAGGRGSRMGGADKGWVVYQGQPLIQHMLQRLRPQVERIIINANRNLPHYQTLGYPVVSDDNQRFDGPLAGMAAGLKAIQSEWLLSVPCDTPLLPLDLAARLWQAAQHAGVKLSIARSASGPHPVCCLIHRSLAADLQAYLAQDQRKVSAWQQQHPHAWVTFEDDLAFTNLNHLPPETT